MRVSTFSPIITKQNYLHAPKFGIKISTDSLGDWSLTYKDENISPNALAALAAIGTPSPPDGLTVRIASKALNKESPDETLHFYDEIERELKPIPAEHRFLITNMIKKAYSELENTDIIKKQFKQDFGRIIDLPD